MVDLLEKDYISYADQVFLYMLKVEDDPDLLETIKKSNPKLKEIAMSVAERLRQEGIEIGQEKGKIEGKLEIVKSMLLKSYPIKDIMLLTGLSQDQIDGIR